MIPSTSPVTRRLSNEQVLGDLAEVLSHRIRNLLAGIEGFTDLLADTLSSKEQRELALRILESAARIEFVLNDLQCYSRPVEMIRIPIDVHDVLNQLCTTLDPDHLHRLTVHVEAETAPLMADPSMLRQALLTLVLNAFDAISKAARVELRVTYDEIASTTTFHVWNPGTINEAHIPQKLFEPFFTTKANNLGIGLPIARRIAEAHGGTLLLSANDPAEGTCFTLSVPFSEDEAW